MSLSHDPKTCSFCRDLGVVLHDPNECPNQGHEGLPWPCAYCNVYEEVKT
jgi:hypothetical protein